MIGGSRSSGNKAPFWRIYTKITRGTVARKISCVYLTTERDKRVLLENMLRLFTAYLLRIDLTPRQLEGD